MISLIKVHLLSDVQIQHSFENLERIIIEVGGPNFEYMICFICLIDHPVGSEDIPLPNLCSHIYHEDCVIRWLNKSNTCPMWHKTVWQWSPFIYVFLFHKTKFKFIVLIPFLFQKKLNSNSCLSYYYQLNFYKLKLC